MLTRLNGFDLPTPCYVIDEDALERNASKLDAIEARTGCQIILALKAFSSFAFFPLLSTYLSGTTASSLNEARLGAEEFGKDIHVYAPAYLPDELEELVTFVSHITFNSISELNRHYESVRASGRSIGVGLRLNPEFSEIKTKIYDPCAPHSRFGVTLSEFDESVLPHLNGFHFHALCGLKLDALKNTLQVVEDKFGQYFHQMDWINFGGGHHLTCEDYDVDGLCEVISRFQDRYGVQVILEPGEAVVMNCGYLVASVVDIMRNEMDIALLDTSATAHMPDILEMPYRATIVGAAEPLKKPHTYRLGGITCLSGDVIGDYSFDQPLEVGDRLVFEDMAQYTVVKNTLFNGVRLPAIAAWSRDSGFRLVKSFGYDSFKSRLS